MRKILLALAAVAALALAPLTAASAAASHPATTYPPSQNWEWTLGDGSDASGPICQSGGGGVEGLCTDTGGGSHENIFEIIVSNSSTVNFNGTVHFNQGQGDNNIANSDCTISHLIPGAFATCGIDMDTANPTPPSCPPTLCEDDMNSLGGTFDRSDGNVYHTAGDSGHGAGDSVFWSPIG
jgi:hypothetical protein